MSSWLLLRTEGQSVSVSGPFRREKIRDLVLADMASWVDFVCELSEPKVGLKWQRISSIEEFQGFLPQLPPKETLVKIEASLKDKMKAPRSEDSEEKESTEEKTVVMSAPRKKTGVTRVTDLELIDLGRESAPWYLQVEGTDFGPFNMNELKRVVESGRFTRGIHVWRKGLRSWLPISGFDELAKILQQAASVSMQANPSHEEMLSTIEKGPQKRNLNRQPLVSTCFELKEGRRNFLGVCMDISSSGIQILLERDLDFQTGDTIRAEVVPVQAAGIPAFEATLKLIWFSPDTQRMGCQFTELDEKTKAHLEAYLASRASR